MSGPKRRFPSWNARLLGAVFATRKLKPGAARSFHRSDGSNTRWRDRLQQGRFVSTVAPRKRNPITSENFAECTTTFTTGPRSSCSHTFYGQSRPSSKSWMPGTSGLYRAKVLRSDALGAHGGWTIPATPLGKHCRLSAAPGRRHAQHEEGRRRGDAEGHEQRQRLTVLIGDGRAAS